MTGNVIGACSICGGSVTVPKAWMSVIPPVPECQRCHAIARSPGPVIEMKPRPRPMTLQDACAAPQKAAP